MDFARCCRLFDEMDIKWDRLKAFREYTSKLKMEDGLAVDMEGIKLGSGAILQTTTPDVVQICHKNKVFCFKTSSKYEHQKKRFKEVEEILRNSAFGKLVYFAGGNDHRFFGAWKNEKTQIELQRYKYGAVSNGKENLAFAFGNSVCDPPFTTLSKDKNLQWKGWDEKKLSREKEMYAALDAFITYKIWESQRKKCKFFKLEEKYAGKWEDKVKGKVLMAVMRERTKTSRRRKRKSKTFKFSRATRSMPIVSTPPSSSEDDDTDMEREKEVTSTNALQIRSPLSNASSSEGATFPRKEVIDLVSVSSSDEEMRE